jgi:cytochrome c biogenesis protein CcdA
MSPQVSLPHLGFSLAAGGLTTLSPCAFAMFHLVVGGALQGNRLGPVAMLEPLVGSALTLVASEGGLARGGLILGVFGLRAAIPLAAVACASRSGFNSVRGWVMARIERVRHSFAVLLGRPVAAILMGWGKRMEALFIRVDARCLGQPRGGHLLPDLCAGVRPRGGALLA